MLLVLGRLRKLLPLSCDGETRRSRRVDCGKYCPNDDPGSGANRLLAYPIVDIADGWLINRGPTEDVDENAGMASIAAAGASILSPDVDGASAAGMDAGTRVAVGWTEVGCGGGC